MYWEELAVSLQGLGFHAQNLCASETQDAQPVYVVKTNGKDQGRKMVHIYLFQIFPLASLPTLDLQSSSANQLSYPFDKDCPALTGNRRESPDC